MADWTWYWHRLRAMSPGEVLSHARKKLRQRLDRGGPPGFEGLDWGSTGVFPRLPDPAAAPKGLRLALEGDAARLMAGRWRAFGHLDLRVDDPPAWQRDYFAGVDVARAEVAFGLNHRSLPRGADVKLVWELSRWHALVRLAQAAHVAGEERAGTKCLDWLEDWVRQNPPYRGWNWTSALETGIRLIQFTWMDALLWEAGSRLGRKDWHERLGRLRPAVLVPHVWHAWRHRSFGSSANNHLLGELAGVILALVRWPSLTAVGVSLEAAQAEWEREVLAQFAPDGGNREQALNYQLFSFEFCWQVRLALLAAGRAVSSPVEERLERAARFFWEVQVRGDRWDYGDSDDAYVTPFFQEEASGVAEWRDWMAGRAGGGAIEYWLGTGPVRGPRLGEGTPLETVGVAGWWLYPESGMAIQELGGWFLRMDLSPLGYLATAAHGHLDALHLSIWLRGTALVVDPGTGAYYADRELRTWLASRAAHNGPCPPGAEYPSRRGPFLWAGRHAVPSHGKVDGGVAGELALPGVKLRRVVSRVEAGDGWVVADACEGGSGFTVRWQFAPGVTVERTGERSFGVKRGEEAIEVEVDAAWARVDLVETAEERAMVEPGQPLAGGVSPGFRRTTFAPYLLLRAAAGAEPCVFRTSFLASRRS